MDRLGSTDGLRVAIKVEAEKTVAKGEGFRGKKAPGGNERYK